MVMDYDQKNKVDDGFYQKDDDGKEGYDEEESSEEIEKTNGSPSSERRKGDEEGTVQKPAAPPAVRVCDFCGKTFSSGKALGGHRRFHLQALKKEGHPHRAKTRAPNRSKPKKKANCDDDVKLVSDDAKPTCYICNKDFPSKKSLFGHMRSHPGRHWRGVLPPEASNKHGSCSPMNSDSMEQDDDDDSGTVAAPGEPAIDRSGSLPSWKKTDKRGRKSISCALAAHILVHLSQGDGFCAECAELPQDANLNELAQSPAGIPIPCKKRKIDEASTSKQQVKKIKVYGRGLVNLENKTDEEDGDCDSDRLNRGKDLYESRDEKVLVNMDCEEEEEDANWTREEYCVKNMKGASDGVNAEVTPSRLQDHDCDFDERKMKKKNKNKNKKRKKLLLKLKTQDSESDEKSLLIKTLNAPNGYKCGICGKSFPTFQALGGHRSSHNKGKNIISAVDEQRPPDAVLAEEYNYSNHILQMKENEESEVRGLLLQELADKVCSETLATAKVIGDHHMRCLSTGLSEEASADEASLSHAIQEMGEASESGPKILDFDLNEPFVMQDEEEDKPICQA